MTFGRGEESAMNYPEQLDAFRRMPVETEWLEFKEAKVKNLRTALRIRGLDAKRIEIDPAGPARGPSAIWRIRKK